MKHDSGSDREKIYRQVMRELDLEIRDLLRLKALIEKRLSKLQPRLFSDEMTLPSFEHETELPDIEERGSRTKVAKQILELEGKPLKTKAIIKALNSHGFNLDTRGKQNALYTALARDSEVRKVGPGLWGLEHWYKESASR